MCNKPGIFNSTSSSDHQHLRAGFLQNRSNFDEVPALFVLELDLFLETERDADLAALPASSTIRDLLETLVLFEDTGFNDGDSGSCCCSGWTKSTSANEVKTVFPGSEHLCPQSLSTLKPEEHNISSKCSSAGPNFFPGA